jgi:hypothetical protein
MTWKRAFLLLLALPVLLLLPYVPRATAQQAAGWFINVDNGRTETSSISFSVGSSQASPKQNYLWRKGQPTTFWIASNSSRLYVNAAVGDHGRNGWFCVYHADGTGNTRGIKHWDFDDSEDHDMSVNDRDGECGN